MSNTCKYEKYRRWISYDSGITWSPMDEYQKGELIERDSVDCGWEPTPPTPEVEYRWVDIPLADDFYCSGTTKYYKQKMQQSEDSGTTWTDVVPPQYRMGASAQSESYDCGYAERTISGIGCDNANKVVFIYYQVSDDHGASWTTTSSTVDSVIEYNSEDCGYVPPTPTGSPYESQYLTFRARERTSFSFNTLYGISYSLDSGATWKSLDSCYVGYCTDVVNSGDTVMWKGHTYQSLYPSRGSGNFLCFGAFDIEGNIMSLFYGDDFVGKTSFEGNNLVFNGLFSGCTGAINAENLILPATTLSYGCYNRLFYNCGNLRTAPRILPATTLTGSCYSDMFRGCTSLVTVPELPATTLTNNCYESMFNGCKMLTTAPELPATTLALRCYHSMFYGCSSLTTAPELPATTLTDYCYGNMFMGCTSLTTAPELLATTLTGSCYKLMFAGCTSLTTAPELPATTLADYCYSEMFERCESLTTAPSVLPATTLANYCYQYMFSGCTSLTTAPTLSATTLANGCCANMFERCTSLTEAPTLSATTFTNYCYSRMFSGCTSLSAITCLATDTSAAESTYYWVQGVAASGVFTKPENSSWNIGPLGIPSGWDIEYTTPPIPRPYEDQYLTFRALESGTFKFSGNSINYSLDSGTTWTELASNTNSPTISRGNTIMWKGNGINGRFSSSGAFDVEGNAMSLLFGDDFSGQTSLVGYSNALRYLFRGCTNLINAKNLVLPAITLTEGCYIGMFRDCGNLTTAPELLATTLAVQCYEDMFYNCSKLNVITCLATNRDTSSTAYWVQSVASAGTFIKNSSMTWSTGVSAIPNGWTVIDYQSITNYRVTSGSPYCSGTTKVVDILDQISINSGVSWITTSSTISVLEYDSADCGYAERWVDIPLTDGYYCSGTTKYYKQKKQKSYDSGSTWSDVVPAEYRMGASAETQSADCGYAERTTSGSPYCSGTTKVVDIYHQESEDSGTSWTTTSTTISVLEYDSADCGYATRVTSGTPYCSGTTKMVDVYDQVTRDSGTTWTTTSTTVTVVEYDSVDCGYDLEGDYLTFKVLSAGDSFKFSNAISYSLDGGVTWNQLPANTSTPQLQMGDIIKWKGNLTPSQGSGIGTFSTFASFNVYGNIMSLLFGDNFSGQTSLSGYDYAFYGLFEGCEVQLANNLILPATTLAPYCYANMFLDCSILAYAPKLPAPTLVEGCYHQMFLYCDQMNYIECLATNPSWQYSYSWLAGTSSSGVFIKDANTTWPSGGNGIPNGWTVEDYQP